VRETSRGSLRVHCTSKQPASWPVFTLCRPLKPLQTRGLADEIAMWLSRPVQYAPSDERYTENQAGLSSYPLHVQFISTALPIHAILSANPGVTSFSVRAVGRAVCGKPSGPAPFTHRGRHAPRLHRGGAMHSTNLISKKVFVQMF